MAESWNHSFVYFIQVVSWFMFLLAVVCKSTPWLILYPTPGTGWGPPGPLSPRIAGKQLPIHDGAVWLQIYYSNDVQKRVQRRSMWTRQTQIVWQFQMTVPD